ncbi:Cell division control protein 25 [Psilocybe cubensis]|uniref:Ras GEF n=2 Tax=Psilocybe cubensis TaxID=181762 RepID=A0A8H8CGE3_PSICU|nr:Cell division control protein 25 [Psilocybe cubensis]KAH9480568.1 Cell division control protein 25 [Psilocybe cubensis]
MDGVTPALYSHSFSDSHKTAAASNTSPSASSNQVQATQQEEQQAVDEPYTTLFCRALYDYEAQDASALSFRTDDIIEVLTQQPSGWWDGLLGEERGWFPSNYVTIISDEEAELAFSQAESAAAETQALTAQPKSTNGVSHASSEPRAEEQWPDNEASYRNPISVHKAPAANGTQQSDFWVPEVTAGNQIYYVNTQTGQRSRDLPQETEDEVSDGDLAGLTSQTSSRSGTSAGLAFGPTDSAEISSGGEDGHRLNGSPDAWVKKLADDGFSHYYVNKLDGRVQWTTPEGMGSSTRSISTMPSSTSRQPDTSRLSVYSDDSDVEPFDHLQNSRARQSNGKSRPIASPTTRTEPNQSAVMELTSAERIAKAVQQALEPPPPTFVTELSEIAKGAIQAVVDNVQATGSGRRPEDDGKMDMLIYSVVLAVRNLLYISTSPSIQLSQDATHGKNRDDRTNSQAPLKPAQRKVTATLSRLVLSARAMQYDSGSVLTDTLTRIETDSEELERAVLSFVLEVQRNEHQSKSGSTHIKRLQGVFSTANIGLGLVGGGSAGSWKGFGYVASTSETGMPKKVLGSEAKLEIATSLERLQERNDALNQALRLSTNTSVQVQARVQEFITHISSFLNVVADIHVARHVDIDGIRQSGDLAVHDQYSETVERARGLVRTLETVTQAIYDDSSTLLLAAQTLHDGEKSSHSPDQVEAYDLLHRLSSSLGSNLGVIKSVFDGLLSVGQQQAELSQGDYNGSIDWRMSRLSVINDHFDDPSQKSGIDSYHSENEDVVDMELAFNRPGIRSQKSTAESSYDSYRTLANSNDTVLTRDSEISLDNTLVTQSPTEMRDSYADNDMGLYEDEVPSTKPTSRPSGTNKLKKLLGDEYADKVAADLQPWYLRPNYSPSDIIIEADGSVRGGTVPALVERLTAHEQADTTFSKAFLMTYKSFTTLDELFDLLVARFRIQPPDNLTQSEKEEWTKLKQHVIQMRVINTMKSMVVDDGVLEKEDMYILDRMKEFISTDEVSRFAAAKHLLIQIERIQTQGGEAKQLVNTNPGPPPPAIAPKSSKKLKLLDIDPLELARQLTIMESQLYQKIKPMECLQRSREQKTENIDNITTVIQTSNRIADWVAESILTKEDSRRRAQVIKHLIAVADRCRTLNNFSTMIAITSGLNTPPIRRLKRTWEQVNQRFMSQFGACEMTIDSNKNFTKYRSLMASVTPPCVPFIGVFLSTLQFIQDGNPDNLPGGLVNFRKRQKASEVINDIKRWQAQPFNFQSLPPVLSFINDSLNQFQDTRASSDRFWALSLEREPREREDEKMARLLQESGFL